MTAWWESSGAFALYGVVARGVLTGTFARLQARAVAEQADRDRTASAEESARSARTVLLQDPTNQLCRSCVVDVMRRQVRLRPRARYGALITIVILCLADGVWSLPARGSVNVSRVSDATHRPGPVVKSATIGLGTCRAPNVTIRVVVARLIYAAFATGRRACRSSKSRYGRLYIFRIFPHRTRRCARRALWSVPNECRQQQRNLSVARPLFMPQDWCSSPCTRRGGRCKRSLAEAGSHEHRLFSCAERNLQTRDREYGLVGYQAEMKWSSSDSSTVPAYWDTRLHLMQHSNGSSSSLLTCNSPNSRRCRRSRHPDARLDRRQVRGSRTHRALLRPQNRVALWTFGPDHGGDQR